MTNSGSNITGMDFNIALGQVIQERRLALGMTLRAVSANGYVSMGHLSDVENGRKEGSTSFINGVARGMGVDPSELIIQAGFRMANHQIPDTPESLFKSAGTSSRQLASQYADLVG